MHYTIDYGCIIICNNINAESEIDKLKWYRAINLNGVKF